MESEILIFSSQKHRLTFSIPLQKWKIDYNKLIVWSKTKIPYIHYLSRITRPIGGFKKILSLIKILDESVIAKFVPAIFITIDVKNKQHGSEYFLRKVKELCGNIGNPRLCQLAFEEIWSDDFYLARLLWEFGKFEIDDEKFQVKIAGKNYTSNGLYGLFVPLNNNEENIEYFKWKIFSFKPSVEDLRKIRKFFYDILTRSPVYILGCIEYKLIKITDEIIKNSQLTIN